MFLQSQSGRVFDFCQWLMVHESQVSQEAAIFLLSLKTRLSKYWLLKDLQLFA